MEGYTPTLGCAMACPRLARLWVSYPRSVFPRRDPLLDAVGRTDNPCERPARCGPCCEPKPKFRLPKEQPECNLDCYQEEQQISKRQEACEEYQKFVKHCCPPAPAPEMVIEPLDPENPIAIELPEEVPPERQCILVERQCRTNIIAGFFNPDDNKSPDERLKEQCDCTYLSCSPGLPMYPCRAIIQYPPQQWTTVGEEMNKCGKFFCKGSKYCDPKFMEHQLEMKRQKDLELKMHKEQEAAEEAARKEYFNPTRVHPCCTNQKLSMTAYCNCGCDKWDLK